MYEETVVNLRNVLPQHLTGVAEENKEKLQTCHPVWQPAAYHCLMRH